VRQGAVQILGSRQYFRARYRVELMQIDYDYLRQLLEAMAAAERPWTDIHELKERGIHYEADQFLFHMEILCDKGLIRQMDGSSDLGMRLSLDRIPSWGAVPLRLTAEGHDFLDGMRNKEVMVVVRRDFKTAGIDTVKAVFRVVLEESARVATEALFRHGAGG
jgi:hypothetical protein